MYNRDKLVEMSIDALKSFDEYCKKRFEVCNIVRDGIGAIRHGGGLVWN